MKYYCSTISVTLAEKLKEKGMPIHIWRDMFSDNKGTDATFASVFDWLAEKGIYVGITRTFARWGWLLFQDHAILQEHFDTWHEAAEAAIEKALTLI